MKIFILCLISIYLFCTFSCKKEKEGVVVDTAVRISVVNSQGQDLLNFLYNKSNITLNRIVNGQKVPYTKEFTIHQENLHVLTLFPSDTIEPNLTLIQFGIAKPDTLRMEFLINSGSIYCSKVWFNGELKFDDSEHTNITERHFTIVK